MTERPRSEAIPPVASDEALVSRFLAGDHRGFEELAERYQHRVYRFICMFLQNDREDAAQEVFLELYRSIGAFEGKSRLETWVFAVTRNVCRRLSRSAWRAESMDADEALLEIPDAAENIERAALSREAHHRVEEALARLAPIHQEVLLLRDWEGLDYREIAETLGIPVGTVRSRLHNATARLAALLQPYGGGADS